MTMLSIDTEGLARKFYRGQTFVFTMDLPDQIQFGQFEGWALSCQLRRLDNPGPSGFIADIGVSWLDSPQCTRIKFFAEDTDEWALGPAVFDVLLTAPDLSQRIRTEPVEFTIVPGVTR